MIGAGGNVARAVLRRLGGLRCHFGRVVLLDKNSRLVRDPHLEHRRLDYSFVRRRLALPADRRWFAGLLRRHGIQIVLDVSTHPTLPVLEAAEAAGASYVNTSLNDPHRHVGELMLELERRRAQPYRAPHILCAGMNPGVVNLWVRHGVAQFGLPRQIIHFEYDTSMTVDGWRPLVTWSKKEFLTETTWNPTGHHDGRQIRWAPRNAVQTQQPLRPLLAPVGGPDHCPPGFLVLHEENLTLGRALGVPSRFLYALHPRTMRYLTAHHRRQGTLHERDLELGDNVSRRLEGTDLVGVCLQYPRRRVYYLNRFPNSAVIGTNATCAQVAVGIYAALFTLRYDRLPPGLRDTGQLHDTVYRQLVFANLRVEQFVCVQRHSRWVVREHTPEVRIRARHDHVPLVI